MVRRSKVFLFCILMICLCFSGCSGDGEKSDAEQTDSGASSEADKDAKKLGEAFAKALGDEGASYVMKADEDTTVTPCLSLNGKDSSFSFTYDILSSYLSAGSYEIEGNLLSAETEDEKYHFTFEIIDNENLRFLQEKSSEIELTNREYGPKLQDKAVFRLREAMAPTKEQVEAMRKKALDGMSDESAARLKDGVKRANESLEASVVRDDLLERLKDPDCLEWNLLEQKGEVQTGWAFDTGKEYDSSSGMTYEEYAKKYGEPIVTNNQYTADFLLKQIADIKENLGNDLLAADLDNLSEAIEQAKNTHDVSYVERAYQIVHDMDYFLLRYGTWDVGSYVSDMSAVSKYYGALEIYQ